MVKQKKTGTKVGLPVENWEQDQIVKLENLNSICGQMKKS